jgi:hypothetical protein
MSALKDILFPKDAAGVKALAEDHLGEMTRRLGEAAHYDPLIGTIYRKCIALARDHQYVGTGHMFAWIAFECLRARVIMEETLMRHIERVIDPVMMVNPHCTRKHRDRIWTRRERFKFRWLGEDPDA